eukprot:5301135-Pyramimonas_sp.AAC.1
MSKHEAHHVPAKFCCAHRSSITPLAVARIMIRCIHSLHLPFLLLLLRTPPPWPISPCRGYPSSPRCSSFWPTPRALLEDCTFKGCMFFGAGECECAHAHALGLLWRPTPFGFSARSLGLALDGKFTR